MLVQVRVHSLCVAYCKPALTLIECLDRYITEAWFQGSHSKVASRRLCVTMERVNQIGCGDIQPRHTPQKRLRRKMYMGIWTFEVIGSYLVGIHCTGLGCCWR